MRRTLVKLCFVIICISTICVLVCSHVKKRLESVVMSDSNGLETFGTGVAVQDGSSYVDDSLSGAEIDSEYSSQINGEEHSQAFSSETIDQKEETDSNIPQDAPENNMKNDYMESYQEENSYLWLSDLSNETQIETDPTVIAKTLWYRACCFYDLESPLTVRKNSITSSEGLTYCPFIDYDNHCEITFTQEGKKELESSYDSVVKRIIDVEEQYYRIDAWRTNYVFRNMFKDAVVTDCKEGVYSFRVAYGGIPEYDDLMPKPIDEYPTWFGQMDVVFEDGKWLVKHIDYPSQ